MKKRGYIRVMALVLCLCMLTPYGYAAQVQASGAEYTQDTQKKGREHILEHNDNLREYMKSGNVQDGDTIIIRGFVHVGSTSELGDAPFVIDKAVTFRGEKTGQQDPTIVLRLGGILLENDVVFENIDISFSNRRRNVIMANGHKLTLNGVKRSPGSREVNLACGGLTDGTVKTQPGDHGEIVISGLVDLDNIYAGSIAHTEWRGTVDADPGKPNSFDQNATVRIKDLKTNSSLGNIYGCGGRQIPIDPSNLFGQEETPPPDPNPDMFKVNGTVNIYLNEGTAREVDGKTGGKKNANIIFDGNYFTNNLKLSNIENLTINSGKVRPTVTGNDLTGPEAKVTVKQGAQLYLQDFTNKSIGNFEGGGTIVLGESDTLNINGAVTGTTKVAVGGVNQNNDNQSNSLPKAGHTYVKAPRAQNENAFELLPYQTQMDMKFEKDDQGNWKVPGAVVQDVKVKEATINQSHTQGRWDGEAVISTQVIYNKPDTMPAMSRIPVTVKVNEEPVIMAGKPQTGYSYTISKFNLKLQFDVIEDDSQKAVDVLTVTPSGSSAFTEGEYKIEIVIPAEYTVNSQEIPLKTVLTITKDSVIPPEPPVPSEIDLSTAKVTVVGAPFEYKNAAHEPEVTVTVNNQRVPEEKYSLRYANNTNAGEATVTVDAKKDSGYIGSKTEKFTIKPAELKLTNVDVSDKTYDGSAVATLNGITLQKKNNEEVTLEAGKGYLATARFDDATAGANKTVTVTVNLAGEAAQNYTLPQNTLTVQKSITKENIVPRPGKMEVSNHRAAEYTYDLEQLLSVLGSGKEYGNTKFTVDTVALAQYNTSNKASVSGTKLVVPIENVDSKEEKQIGTITVGIETDNYDVGKATINVYAVNKTVPIGVPKLSATTLTYGDKLSKIKLSGEMKDASGSKIDGTFAWVNPDEQPKAGSFKADWKFTPVKEDVYQTVTGQETITVNRAVPTGKPSYTPITEDKKTLADAHLSMKPDSFSVEGSVKWDMDETTEVKRGVAYSWTFTPKDTVNFEKITGEITLYAAGGSSGGGSSGGGSSGGGSQGGSQTNPDGSTTTVDKTNDGSVITTTKYPDGSSSKVEVKKDGASISTNTTANGTVGKVTEDAAGNVTEIFGQVSNKDAQQAKENGEPVKVPVKVAVSSATNQAPSVKLAVPQGGVAVEIPVDNLTAGTVAILVGRDGKEEVVKQSSLTKDGVTLNLERDATIKVVDNSKTFHDVQESAWYKDAVDFMSARELVEGTSDAVFNPETSLSRSMLAMILYNLEDKPTVGQDSGFSDVAADSWYADAINWATKSGIIVGYDNGTVGPNNQITREQLAVMLYRYAGSPTSNQEVSGFVDGDAISDFAKPAMSWAVENGVISGKGGGKLDPQGKSTRAEAVQMLMNFMT